MILAQIKKISYDPESKGYLVEIVTSNDNETLKILVSTKDAKQISLAKEGVNLPRPSTHDLLLDFINSFDVKLKKIIISDFKLSTFYAKIVLYNHNLGEVVMDSRPSDAIVMSLKSNCPLYISSDIFTKIISKKPDLNFRESQHFNQNEMLLEKLNDALDKAVFSEEYETAAKIRDQINEIKSEKTK